jgi:hypothetical protein
MNSKVSRANITVVDENFVPDFSNFKVKNFHDGGNGGGNDMLDRVKKLEEQMLSLLTDVAIIKSNYVTKADLHEEISKQTKWIAATIIGTTAAALAVARLIF